MMSNNCPDDYLLDTLPGLSYKSQASVSSFELRLRFDLAHSYVGSLFTLFRHCFCLFIALGFYPVIVVSRQLFIWFLPVLVAKLQLAFASVLASPAIFSCHFR
ncbi:hypothetical protein BD560DRAFT_478211 [Blakeslea trispora]|nr:hypothetical protein BD560DRAFT_493819 [Blakeslea trispora]KAI8350639.1 hypothetical protein BD560DRAFT_478211 [Blakeslea trispora]